MTGSARPKAKRQTRLLLLLPLLLAVAVAANWDSVNKLRHGKVTWRSVLTGRADRTAVSQINWKQPADLGDPRAKVVVEVFLAVGDSCHLDTAYFGQALGTVEPRRIRVKFVDTHSAAGAERRERLKLGCEQGLALNGRTEFKVPDPERPGKQKTVFLTHDGGGLPVFYRLLNREVKATYKGKGLALSEAEFNAHLQAEIKRVSEAMEAAAKQELAERKKHR